MNNPLLSPIVSFKMTHELCVRILLRYVFSFYFQFNISGGTSLKGPRGMLDICRGHGECWTFVGGMGNAGHIFVGGKGNAGHSATHELIIHHALYVKSLR